MAVCSATQRLLANHQLTGEFPVWSIAVGLNSSELLPSHGVDKLAGKDCLWIPKQILYYVWEECHRHGQAKVSCQLSELVVLLCNAFAGNERLKAFCVWTVYMSVGTSVCDHMPTISEHDIFQTACGNFIKFATSVQLETKMNWLGFKVKKSGIRVTWRPSIVKNHLLKNAHFQRKCTDQHFTVEGQLVHQCLVMMVTKYECLNMLFADYQMTC